MIISKPAASLRWIALIIICICAASRGSAEAAPIRVAYAGSMGAVMDQQIGPAFAKTHGVEFQGIGQASYALAHLIEGHQLQADVFVSVTPGPMRVVLKDGLAKEAIAIASTQMALAYSPRSSFGSAFAAPSGRPWYQILQSSGLHFGRTDPATDPQGRNVIFTLLLAQNYYHAPELAAKILGDLRNPAQIFTEPSLLTRLESGQIDATIGYLSAIKSQHLPFLLLPRAINLSDPGYFESSYSKVSFSIEAADKQPTLAKPEPLVFYAAALTNAEHPDSASAFIAFLTDSAAQSMFRSAGYDAAARETLR